MEMYIIADMEWVQNKRGHISITQLSAVRVDENWRSIGRFFTRVRPIDPSFHDWRHMAYTGGRPVDFLYAKHCITAFEEFRLWAGEDPVCWWGDRSEKIHATIDRGVLKQEHKPAVILNEIVRSYLGDLDRKEYNAYQLARERGIEVPAPEHDSRNDVEAILRLFRGISFPQDALSRPPVRPEPPHDEYDNDRGRGEALAYQYDTQNARLHKKECPLIPEGTELLGVRSLFGAIHKGYRPCACVRDEWRRAKRERVADEINRSEYNYLFAEHGNVFHRRDCGLLRNANHVLGTVKYESILKKGLRPCKVCCPSPDVRPCKVCRPSPDKPCSPVPFQQKKRIKQTPRVATRSLTRAEMTAMTRLRQSQKERFSGVLQTDMTPQEKQDLYTFTQPGLAFFAARGYQTFHNRNCPKLAGRSDIRGFGTFSQAQHAGYIPCKYCKPTVRQNIVVSIPIDNRIRTDETVEDLAALCEQYGYEYRSCSEYFELETPAGKWRIDTSSRPVTVEHINLARDPYCRSYHQQHRIFLSMLDAVYYIHRHDTVLYKRIGDGGTGVPVGVSVGISDEVG